MQHWFLGNHRSVETAMIEKEEHHRLVKVVTTYDEILINRFITNQLRQERLMETALICLDITD